ncbi:Bromo adjacent homology (BAH) domain [Macleaya cordata]|uniref:Bromo adjacent homology (BAH) domain n=1 Tax=Macleaya cordata TaxID=56857 RepID=A0A200R0M3_MACCD|nr:Bromo adjacent homology (BAH) domain [Macleaya cordata]
MHGREGEDRKTRRHMWPVPALGKIVGASDSTIAATSDFFCKNGRKIAVGDCALFKPNQESSPPFIGIIRCLTSGKEDYLKLGVNWLYRPADVKLGKGIFLEAAPNEVFYSFHKDEIPAASLLHPCKVAFLRKGVELPSGISSFVCRRVYDIANKRLWWLTDQDYINERQEEVDKLLDKTRLEMHAAVQSGGRSPKTLNVSTSASQLKPGSDSIQNSATALPSQVKGKKRDRSDQGSELVKRERFSKTDDGDSGQFRLENMLKSEISKITDKGGLVDYEGVEKLVQLMQPDRAEKKIELAGRIMLADVIGATERNDCLGRFVQLRGLSVLDEWLQEVHKGKIGDGSSPKESDKPVEDLLLALLRALDKLPVNLHALQTCNVGKSVNNLRSHKNLEIQKKSRSLVDTWKKRVEAEMKINDTKSGSTQAASWPSKQCMSEVSHGGNRRTGGSSEGLVKNSVSLPSASKTAPVKFGHGDAATKTSPGSVKLSAPLSAAVASSKDSNCKVVGNSGTPDPPLTSTREEKSSGSSQSQNNSQSCSSDQAKTVCGSSWKEDARSSTAGSMNLSKTSSGASRHRKSSNGFPGSVVSGAQKETSLGKCSSANRNVTSEKFSQSGSTCERTLDVPAVDHGNSHRLIVRLPNPGRSPARTASICSFDDHPSAMVSRASSPGLPEKNDQSDRKVKGKSDAYRANIATDVNTESWQSNDVKDGLAGSDEGGGSPDGAIGEERYRPGDELGKSSEASKGTCSSSGNDKGVMLSEPKLGKLNEASLSSINALVESCVKASASMSVGDDVGMNLLASVAAGEMSKSELVSPIGSPRRSLSVPECMENDAKLRLSCEDVTAQIQSQPDDGADGDADKQGVVAGPLRVKDEFQHIIFSGDGKTATTLASEEKLKGESSEQFHISSIDVQRTANPCLKSDVKPDEAAPVADTREEGAEREGGEQLCEKKTSVTGCKVEEVPDCKLKSQNFSFDQNKKVDHADGICLDKMTSTSAASVKVEKEVVEQSNSCPSLGMGVESKNLVHEGSNGGIRTKQKLPPVTDHSEAVEGNAEDTLLSSGSGSVLCAKDADKLKVEKTDGVEARIRLGQSENQRMEQTSTAPSTVDDRVAASVGSVLDQSGAIGESSDRKVRVKDRSGGSASEEELPLVSEQETEGCVKSSGSKLSGVEGDELEECASTTGGSSQSVAAGSDTAAKLDFDLNEGFPVDEGNQGDAVTSAALGCSSVIHLHSPLQFPLSSLSSSLPASITVAAAAKGSFVPPDNLLRSKGETGWKGSAATSAFRRAEPRKVLEMSLSTTDLPHDISATKQGRPPLNIDLNVADERVLEDMASQSSMHETRSDSGFINTRDLGRSEMFGSSGPVRSGAGLDLDLNRIGEDTDISHFSASTSRRVEVPLLPVRSSSSGAFPNGDVNVLRDFDLNNGPGVDELSTEPTVVRQHTKASVPFLPPVAGLRMNNTEMGSLSSWFPIGNSYPAVAIPSILPERGEQHYPVVGAAGAQRILGPPTGGTNFGPDMYRGPVLSSSPAVAYSPATAYPYPGFPFGTSFSLPSTSFSGGSATYLDSSSGGGLCFPAVPSQLLGPAAHYPRPYVISLQDGTSNGGAESSRKWGRQGLDLNAGPGGSDIEGREERYSSAPRQLPVASSQALTEEQGRMYQTAAGAALKRKEPEGGWDMERFSYKQPSWQ